MKSELCRGICSNTSPVKRRDGHTCACPSRHKTTSVPYARRLKYIHRDPYGPQQETAPLGHWEGPVSGSSLHLGCLLMPGNLNRGWTAAVTWPPASSLRLRLHTSRLRLCHVTSVPCSVSLSALCLERDGERTAGCRSERTDLSLVALGHLLQRQTAVEAQRDSTCLRLSAPA